MQTPKIKLTSEGALTDVMSVYYWDYWKNTTIFVIKIPLRIAIELLRPTVQLDFYLSLAVLGALRPIQYGFIPQISTEHALYDAVELARDKVRNKKLVAMHSLNIEEAFIECQRMVALH